MKIEHIEYFTKMKDARSLSEAASKAHISQQGYGKVIAALEKSLGCKLLHRDAKGAQLTGAGAIFMSHAEAIVAEFSQARDELRTHTDNFKVLREYEGSIAFSNICMIDFERLFSDARLLEQANRHELPLDQALERCGDSEWVCFCDICPQIYTDYLKRWDVIPLSVGRVGLVAQENMLETVQARGALDAAVTLPIGLFDCFATREIYKEIFGADNFGNIRMRTTNNTLLARGVARGDFAVLSDSFNWRIGQSHIESEGSPLIFMPFEREMESIFGIVRKKGLAFSPEQQQLVDSLKCVYEHLTLAL